MPENKRGLPDPIIEEYGRLSPEKIIELKKEDIQERIKLFEQVYNEYVDRWRDVYLNPYLLREAVESYYCDIYRLKFFRQVDRINEHKKAAYTMKWLARIRPVQMREGAGPAKSIVMVNAYFALMAGLTLLDVDNNAIKDEWWRTFITDMTYLLHHHSVSVETLTQAMSVLKALDSATK